MTFGLPPANKYPREVFNCIAWLGSMKFTFFKVCLHLYLRSASPRSVLDFFDKRNKIEKRGEKWKEKQSTVADVTR